MGDDDERVDEESALDVRSDDALAVRGTRSADAYEAQYMKGHGRVLHRAKATAPRWLQAVLIAPAVLSLPTLAAGWAGLAIFALVVPFAIATWALFSVLRTTVSEGAVNIQYGVFGPTIPIAAIESVEVTTYDWKRVGWGIKRTFDGAWMYNMPGDEGRAVRLVWRDTDGGQKKTMIGDRDAQALANAISAARANALPHAEHRRELPEQSP